MYGFKLINPAPPPTPSAEQLSVVKLEPPPRHSTVVSISIELHIHSAKKDTLGVIKLTSQIWSIKQI